jgi:hypothetical protein
MIIVVIILAKIGRFYLKKIRKTTSLKDVCIHIGELPEKELGSWFNFFYVQK